MTVERALRTETLDHEGATLTFDVHGGPAGPHRPLMVIGSPMGADGFTDLVGYLSDRMVITYDPRGTGRSPREATGEITPSVHAGDLAAILRTLDLGQVDMFASSGGAVNALALAVEHPGLVHTLVAHEPPVLSLLPDAQAAHAAVEEIGRAYDERGFGAGMAQFIAFVSHQGEIGRGGVGKVDPADFGLPTSDDGTRGDALLEVNLRPNTRYVPDVAALLGGPTRLIIAVGAESDHEPAHRSAEALAETLHLPAIRFPGDHGGFAGPSAGMAGKPEEFAGRLLEVLGDGALRWSLEVVIVPVTNLDVSIAFYRDLAGFTLDHRTTNEHVDIAQLTPRGSGCSIVMGTLPSQNEMAPGSLKGVHLVVPDARAAHAELRSRGVEVSDVTSFDDRDGGTFFGFSDPDGNTWAVQQLQARREFPLLPEGHDARDWVR